ncbi:MAG TPA: OmpA family protein [Polyangiaceae bacterium]|nr:OmpA family protein [Polyangiaceae bacterium]
MVSHSKFAKSLGLSLVVLGVSSSAVAQQSVSLSASTSDGGNASASGGDSVAPAPSADLGQAPLELGLFGGAFFSPASHDIYSTTHEAFTSPALELGGRIGVYPLSFLGLEVEAAGMPTTTKTTDVKAGFWAVRGHLIGQARMGSSFGLFALAGAGGLSAGSTVTGTDADLVYHFGVGAKLGLDDMLGLRLDLRDTLGQKFQASRTTPTHFPEVLLGLTFGVRKPVVAPPPPPPPPPDADGDGIADDNDACKNDAGPAPDGCPDSDGDGLMDNKDACPKEAGSAPCGCPPRDKDGDKVIDELDKCPDVAGPVEGCPDPDSDHDGVLGAADKCPDKPETLNGFEDDDGCPDQIPEKVKKFTGVIRGIEFDKDADTIRPISTSTLDNAALVLGEFPSLRVLISGHTDTDGTREHNLDLSARRAASVKAYFVGKGIDGSRIETRGAGPDEPIADNKTKAGKQKNRRIEFKLLEGAAPSKAPSTDAPAAPAAPAPAAPGTPKTDVPSQGGAK